MGFIIEFFKAPPFIVTLAGMFFSRGFGYVLSLGSVPITYDFYKKASAFGFKIGNGKLTVSGMALIAVVIIAIFLSRRTKFGRNIYAIGGNEQSAVFMVFLFLGQRFLFTQWRDSVLHLLASFIHSIPCRLWPCGHRS